MNRRCRAGNVWSQSSSFCYGFTCVWWVGCNTQAQVGRQSCANRRHIFLSLPNHNPLILLGTSSCFPWAPWRLTSGTFAVQNIPFGRASPNVRTAWSELLFATNLELLYRFVMYVSSMNFSSSFCIRHLDQSWLGSSFHHVF